MGAPTLGFHDVTKTSKQDIDGLLSGFAWNAGVGQTTRTITYSFPTSSTPYGTKQGTGAGEYPVSYPFEQGFGALTQAQMTDVQRAFGLLSSYTGLTFTQVTEGTDTRGTIRLANTGASAHPTAVGFYPGSAVTAGDIFFGGTGRNPAIGNFDSSQAVLHEIGHALGLKHGQDTQPFGPVSSDKLDIEFSIMNYPNFIGDTSSSATVAVGSSPQTYMMYDIAALQTLYGASFAKVGQNVTYTWSASNGEESINGVGQGIPIKNPSAPFAPQKIFMTVWTEGANSTYDLSSFRDDGYLDMRPGGWMKFSNVQLARLGTNSAGGAIVARANVFNALQYGTDTRSEIDNLITGNGNNTVYGNDVYNTITLGNGNDTLYAGKGGAQIFAGNGNDILNGGDGNEIFSLTGGTYTVTGGAGNNVLDLTNLTPLGGDPFTITNNNGTGTVYEGTTLRVTFAGMTSIDQPDFPTNVPNVTPPPAIPPEQPIVEVVTPATAGAAQAGNITSVTTEALNGSSAMTFTDGGAITLTGPNQTVLLQQGHADEITGFDPTSDKLDVTQVLAQSQISLSDVSQLSNYFGLAVSGSDATLSFDPSGQGAGGGSALATLIGTGSSISLNTLIGDQAVKWS